MDLKYELRSLCRGIIHYPNPLKMSHKTFLYKLSADIVHFFISGLVSLTEALSKPLHMSETSWTPEGQTESHTNLSYLQIIN